MTPPPSGKRHSCRFLRAALVAAILALGEAALSPLHAAVPEVSGVTMAQASDRLVTITYTLADANLDLLGRYERDGGKVQNGTSYVNPVQSCGATNATAIVGSYAPNAWGLYDMHGNVWEWCLDWYEDNIATAKDASGEPYGGRVNINPATPAKTLFGESSAKRVRRGGSYDQTAGGCRPAYRVGLVPTATENKNVGFRVLCSAGLR